MLSMSTNEKLQQQLVGATKKDSTWPSAQASSSNERYKGTAHGQAPTSLKPGNRRKPWSDSLAGSTACDRACSMHKDVSMLHQTLRKVKASRPTTHVHICIHACCTHLHPSTALQSNQARLQWSPKTSAPAQQVLKTAKATLLTIGGVTRSGRPQGGFAAAWASKVRHVSTTLAAQTPQST